MKITVVLIALTCLLGLAGAQTIGMGEGYSSTQLSFFNSPGSSTFEPDVANYWGNYITNQESQGIKSTSSNMDIWMINFPLSFNSPLQLKATSFNANTEAPVLTATQRNSQFLTRNVNSRFDINQAWSYPISLGSLTVSNSTGTPSKDAKGKMMSQNIMVLFST